WDSGKVASPRAVGVPYDGPILAPRTRYYWSVRLWDRAGRATDWAEPAWFETGLLDEGFGPARWIGAKPDVEAPPLDLGGASWIWSADASTSNAPVGPRWFRGHLALPSDVRVAAAHLVMT